MPIKGDEACARPVTAALILNSTEANLLRRLLADEAGCLHRAGRHDDAQDTLELAARVGHLQVSIDAAERADWSDVFAFAKNMAVPA